MERDDCKTQISEYTSDVTFFAFEDGDGKHGRSFGCAMMRDLREFKQIRFLFAGRGIALFIHETSRSREGTELWTPFLLDQYFVDFFKFFWGMEEFVDEFRIVA